MPPLYILWDAQSYTGYAQYHKSGATTAKKYWQLFRTYTMTRVDGYAAPQRVLEWAAVQRVSCVICRP